MIIDFPTADPHLQALGRRLRRLRALRSVSLEGLAERLGVVADDLERAERGRLRLSATQLYAATLHLHIPMRLLFED